MGGIPVLCLSGMEKTWDVNVKAENKEYVFSSWDESFQAGLF